MGITVKSPGEGVGPALQQSCQPRGALRAQEPSPSAALVTLPEFHAALDAAETSRHPRPHQITISGASVVKQASQPSAALLVRLSTGGSVVAAARVAPVIIIPSNRRTMPATQALRVAPSIPITASGGASNDASIGKSGGKSGGNVAAVATAGSAAIMGLGMIISGALGYVQTIAMTHMVSRSAYGIFVVVFTTVTFVSQVAKLGLDGVLLRFLPSYRTTQERGLAAALVRFTLLGPTALSFLCALVLFIGAPLISMLVFHSDKYTTPFREAAVLIPLISLQGMLLNGLCAMKNFKWQVYVGKVIEPIATLVLMVIFFLLGLGLEALILAYIFGISASIFAGGVVFRRDTRALIHDVAPIYAPKTWIRFGSAMLVNVMTTSVIQSTDVLGIGVYSTSSQVSLYRIADRVSSLIAMPYFALSSIFSPTIAELHARGDHTKLESMFALITRWSFTLSWPICLACVLFPDAILRVFGVGYTAGAEALYILAAGNIINAATGPVGSMLAMTGKVRILWFNTALRVALNLGLIVALVPRYGILGAAAASSLTVAIFNIIAVIEVWWTMKLQPYRWDIVKPILAGAVASVAGLLLLNLTHVRLVSGIESFLYACALVCALVLVYALILMRMGLSAEDLSVIAAVVKKFRIRRT